MMNDKLTAFLVIMLAVLAAMFVYDAYNKNREKKEIEQSAAEMLKLMQMQQTNGQNVPTNTTM